MGKQIPELLLVEDSAFDAELTITALREKHLANNLYHVEDGAEALDFVFARGRYADREASVLPSLILLDLKMPRVDGLEVLRQLKEDAATKSIPVVVLTSSKEDPDIKRCYALGANSYIVKPVSFDNFSKVVTEVGLYWAVLNVGPEES